jgi:uncharacterized membrane protein/thiol-disulfide isomerase/thioredoxin
MKLPQRTVALLALAILALSVIAARPGLAPQTQQGAVVHAVLFYSPTCPRCQEVITEDLPPLMDTYGAQLEIVGINVTFAEGQALFQAAWEQYSIPEDLRGVPLLVIGDTWLVGARDIPEQLPGLIEQGLAHGGIDWPEIPGLAEAIAGIPTPGPTIEATSQPAGTPATPPTTASTAAPATAPAAAPTPIPLPTEQPATVLGRIQRDPVGNGLAIVVLIGMIASVVVVAIRFLRPSPYQALAWQVWAFPVLCLVGAGVAAYLSYVEASGATAVCGPVGDCNTVQQSQYARLFGVLPIGALGLAAYLLMLVTWLLGRIQSGRYADWAAVANFGMSAIGTLFSGGLTFLEPFVIGATCAWCLASAIVITALLWLGSGPGTAALARLEAKEAEAADEAK